MTEEEFIRQARLDWEEDTIETMKDALEICFLNGNYDDSGGDAEAPTGHYYKCERWIVTTDSDGNNTVHTFESEEEAEARFRELEEEFDEWDG